MKFKQKPIVIEAMQWDGSNAVDIQHFVEGGRVRLFYNVLSIMFGASDETKLNIGEWIIKDTDGTYRKSSNEAFEKAYYPVKQKDVAGK